MLKQFRIKNISRYETVWARASRNTRSFRQDSEWWFWGVEVVGAALFAGGGGLLGGELTPSNATVFWQGAYPTIGGAIGLIVGLITTYLGILVFNLVKVPYQQRDEARRQVRELKKADKDAKEGQSNNDISLVYDDIFYSVCKERLDNKDELHRIGVQNLGVKTIYDVEIRTLGQSTFPALPELPLKFGDSSTFSLNPSSEWHLDRVVDFLTWHRKEKTIEFCFANQNKSYVYKLVRGHKYSVGLGITAKDTRVEKEWTAILSYSDRKFDIDFSEVEVTNL